LCGFVSELTSYHTCPAHAAASIDEIISFVAPIPRELIQHIQSYSALLYELESMGFGNDINNVIDEVRSTIVSTLEEYNTETFKFAVQDILSLFEYTSDLSDLIRLIRSDCHSDNLIYLIDSGFKILESFGLSEFAITFEENCKQKLNNL
jgi:hypothetical protein